MKLSFFPALPVMFAILLSPATATAEETSMTLMSKGRETVFVVGDRTTPMFQRTTRLLNETGYTETDPAPEKTDVWCEIRPAHTEKTVGILSCHGAHAGSDLISITLPYVLAANDGNSLGRRLGEMRTVVRNKINKR